MWTDLDRTPVILFPDVSEAPPSQLSEQSAEPPDDYTPSVPLLLTRRSPTASWDPPPLRKLLESAPPPPRQPSRSLLELHCGMSSFASDLMVSAPEPDDEVTVPRQATPARRRATLLPWVAAGATYALGIATVVAIAQGPLRRAAADGAASSFEVPLLGKSAPQAASPQAASPQAASPQAASPKDVESTLRASRKLFGFVTDPAPNDSSPGDATTIDLPRLRLVIAAAAAHAGVTCNKDSLAGTTRVAVTIAPSGRATRAVLLGGPFNGTATSSCIADALSSVAIPAFAGQPTTITQSVTLPPKR